MQHQVDQLTVFIEMTKAIEDGQTAKVKRADNVVRRALERNKSEHVRSCVFFLSDKDKALLGT